MTDLKPCPFCGREVKLNEGTFEGEKYYSIHHIYSNPREKYENIDLCMYENHVEYMKKKIIKKWNTRNEKS